jgi:hypothetical protein
MVEEGICFSPYSLKLATLFRWYLNLAILPAREDVEVHLHASQTKATLLAVCMGELSSRNVASLL